MSVKAKSKVTLPGSGVGGVVVLASGGVDSGVLVNRANRAGRLVGLAWFNYGQPAALCEWRALEKLRRHLGIEKSVPVHEVPLTMLVANTMRSAAGESGPRVVPHRNLVMLSLALNWAESIDAREIWYGAISDDYQDYADCRGTFVKSLNEALDAPKTDGMAVRHPFISAPLLGLNKSQVIDEANTAGILSICWSCYTPVGERLDRPCGTCNSCRSRGSE